jgi:hypothetical protein
MLLARLHVLSTATEHALYNIFREVCVRSP